MRIELDESDIEEFKREKSGAERYQAELLHSPDCRDPDHPGCEKCEPEDDPACG